MPAFDVVILGAGAAGLTCRMALASRRETVCLEASTKVGGLLRMYHHGAYSFDTTVHALFFSDPATRSLVESLIEKGFHRFRKRNLVYRQGRVIGYPLQFHALSLPRKIREECLAAVPPAPAESGDRDEESFEDWLLAQFGSGFYRHFFEPYNRKLYGIDPAELEAAPMVWTIPADNRKAILLGASPDSAISGPGTECLYPRGRTGIELLPLGLEERGTGEILCGHRVVRVDLGNRTVTTDRGLEIGFGTLISTIPLPVLLRSIRGLPPPIQELAEKLEARSVTTFRIAAEKSGEALDADWVYFPDPEIPFYRLTRLERISPDLAPEGSAALLLECAGDPPPAGEQVVRLCRELGVAGAGEVVCEGSTRIPYAYVLFRRGHREACDEAIRYLEGHDVHVAGRYGAWRYANIAQTIESALHAVRTVLSRPARRPRCGPPAGAPDP